MRQSNYRETALYFSERLGSPLPEIDFEKSGLELTLDEHTLNVRPGSFPGEVTLELPLGMVVHPVPEERIKELMTSNYLGVNTGGCTLAFDEAGVTLLLKTTTSAGTPPQENWEWLHRVLCVAQEWLKIFTLWEEFVPLLKRG